MWLYIISSMQLREYIGISLSSRRVKEMVEYYCSVGLMVEIIAGRISLYIRVVQMDRDRPQIYSMQKVQIVVDDVIGFPGSMKQWIKRK